LALIRYDSQLAWEYSRLLENEQQADAIWSRVDEEFRRTHALILQVKRQPHLLSDTPWLLDSFARRIDAIDLTNSLQLELIRRRRSLNDGQQTDVESLDLLLRQSVQTLATGLRNTG